MTDPAHTNLQLPAFSLQPFPLWICGAAASGRFVLSDRELCSFVRTGKVLFRAGVVRDCATLREFVFDRFPPRRAQSFAASALGVGSRAAVPTDAARENRSENKFAQRRAIAHDAGPEQDLPVRTNEHNSLSDKTNRPLCSSPQIHNGKGLKAESWKLKGWCVQDQVIQFFQSFSLSVFVARPKFM